MEREKSLACLNNLFILLIELDKKIIEKDNYRSFLLKIIDEKSHIKY